jgi:hypothetical protein
LAGVTDSSARVGSEMGISAPSATHAAVGSAVGVGMR